MAVVDISLKLDQSFIEFAFYKLTKGKDNIIQSSFKN